MRDVVGQRPRGERGDECIRHSLRDRVEVGRRCGVAALPGKPGALRVILPRGIEPDDVPGLDHLQPPADMHRRRGDHLAALDHRELGGAAADVDVEEAPVRAARSVAAPEPYAASIASM